MGTDEAAKFQKMRASYEQLHVALSNDTRVQLIYIVVPD